MYFVIWEWMRGWNRKVPAAEGSVTVILTASEPVELNRIAVFPGQAGFGAISSLKIVLDNELSSKEYVICDEDTVPLILDFPIHLAKRIEVLFSLREGEMSIGLSEIMLIREEG